MDNKNAISWPEVKRRPELQNEDRSSSSNQPRLFRQPADSSGSVGQEYLGVFFSSGRQGWQQSRIVFVDRDLCELNACSSAELLGKSPQLLLGSQLSSDMLDFVEQELSQGRPCTIEIPAFCKDADQVEMRTVPLLPSSDGSVKFVSILNEAGPRDVGQLLRKSQDERFRQIFEHAPTGIAIADFAGRFLHCNEAYREIVGYDFEELYQVDFALLVHPEDRDHNLELVRRLNANEISSFEIENRYVRKNGEAVWVNKFVSILRDENGDPTDLIALVTDVTARRLAERSVVDNEFRLKAILDTAVDAIVSFDKRGIIESVNPAMESMFGYSSDELNGQDIQIVMPVSQPLAQYGDNAADLGTAASIRRNFSEFIGIRKDGSKFPVEMTVSQVGDLDVYTAILRDVTERFELQKQILEIAAVEDRRIGSELHDNIQQQLTGLGLLATGLADSMEQQSSAQTSAVCRLAQGINEINHHIHLLARGLIPVEVNALGLRSALSDLADRVSEQYKAECNFQGTDNIGVADNFVATHLYRIAQESINNAVKHGKASRIDISLVEDQDSIELRVENNGIEFDPNLPAKGCGMGLQIIEYRASLIGGTIQIVPGIAGGMVVKCKISRAEGDQ